MVEHHLPLASVYKGWESYQRHLVTVVAPLSPEQLTLRAAPSLRSLREQVIHLIAARARLLSLHLHEDAPELEPLMSWDGWGIRHRWDAPPVRSAPELVGGLETTWQVLQTGLDCWTVADLEQVFPPPFPGEESFTRQFVLWNLMAHDLHHGGEISVVLEMHGLTGIQL